MKSSLRLAVFVIHTVSMSHFIVFVIHTVSMSHFIGLALANCDMPEPVPNTMSTLSNQKLSIGSYIIWECREGYIMQGDTNTVVWVCVEDGSWLGQKPMCKAIECPSPPMAAYSTLDPPLAEAPVVNETITYSCSSDEYTLIGQSSNGCLQDGTWENDPPICQRECPGGTTRYSNLTCYRTRNTRATWDKQLNFCERNDELLITVKDDDTQNFTVRLIQNSFNADVWIGAREGLDWKWRRGDTYINRFFWENAYPDPEANSGDCIELSYQSNSRKFTWSPRSPEDSLGVLCQYNQSCQSAGLEQSDMVLDYIGNCFQFLNVSVKCDDWTEECNGRGGFLAEILDESTNALLSDRALYLRNNSIVAESTAWWIGGYDEDDSGRSWFWSDKTRLIYEAWASGQPNENTHDCIRMERDSNYQWYDWGCSERRRSLCQIGIPACGDPGQPLHGYRLPNDRTTYSVDATLHFACEEGYELIGTDILRCMNNGSWDQPRPSCEATICLENPPLVELASSGTRGSSYQDITIYTCQDGYIPNNEPISFCQHNGTWSTPNFTCTALSPCYSNPCMNGGTCYFNGTSFTCTCPSTYTGLACNEELKSCDSNPCLNGGTCSDSDGPSFTCTCPSSYTGLTCNEEISLTTSFIVTTHSSTPNTEAQTDMPLTSAHLLTSFSPTTRLPSQSTEVLTESPGGASSPSAAIAAGSTLAVLLIVVVIILSIVLFRRRRTGKPVPPHDENEMENYAAVANCYEHNKPVGSTPHAPYYLTVVPDSSENGGTAGPVAKQPSPHLQKGGEQKKQPPVINGSGHWNETHTREGFVDNILYGTSDEQPEGLPSLHSTPNDTKPGAHAKKDTAPTFRQTTERQRAGNAISGIPTADDNVYESYEDGETLIDNVLYNATPSPTSGHRQFDREVDGTEEVYENPDENVYADCEDEETLIDNVLYSSSSPATPRASKHNAVVDQGNGEVYENPDDSVYEAYEEEGSMVENELYSAATPPTPRADRIDPVTEEESGEVYQNSEFHDVPTNLITNELYKSVDEI